MTEPLMSITGLTKHFDVSRNKGLRKVTRTVQAVNDVSIDIGVGETVGLVGESGSGKTTTGRCILRLTEPTAGSIVFDGQEITDFGRRQMNDLRRRIQIVFQDPQASLDPRQTIGRAVAGPLRIQGVKGDHQQRVAELLELVGLPPDCVSRFPHEFSGGQRQRIGIARALALKPDFIVLDEPVSALDVSIQAGVVNLLQDLQAEMNLSFLFIAHDLSVVRHISNRIAVMYLGRVVEFGEAEAVYSSPTHPYTQALLSAVPEPDPKARSRRPVVLEGEVPSPMDPPSGCTFRTRCPIAQPICAEEVPALIDRGVGHPVACHFAAVNPVTEWVTAVGLS